MSPRSRRRNCWRREGRGLRPRRQSFQPRPRRRPRNNWGAEMRVELFDFDLPPDRIALRPASPRDSARLLRVEASGLSDHCVSDLPQLLRPGDLLVFNDTRVIPAQLEGRRGEARIGATLHKREAPRSWRAFLRNAKRVRDNDLIRFGDGVAAIATEKAADGSALLTFEGEEPVEV